MCDYFQISRSGYYKQLKSVEHSTMEESIIIDLVLEQRHQMPRIGGKKLHFTLKKICR
jgi:hypothetical protein